jgi:hypothetical protein
MAAIPPGSSSVETFRVDVSWRAWPLLTLSATLTTIGALAVCTAFVARGMFVHKDAITHVGTLCMLVGPLSAIVALRKLLQSDEYVAALDTGVLVHCAGIDAFVAWGDVETVKHDQGAIVVARTEGEPIRIERTFARGKVAEVAARMDDVRRKVMFGLKQ